MSHNSAIYRGDVFHARFVPRTHRFRYKIFLFWLDLDELDSLSNTVSGFSAHKWAPVRFCRKDYLGDASTPLKESVLARMSELAGKPLSGSVYLLGQCRMFGMYFSPVNFYYLQTEDGTFSHVLAEVSNTPWNERHHYLVDLRDQRDTDKQFFVSPFNPMDMRYKWRISQPDQKLALSLSCHQDNKHFDASLRLTKHPLNSRTLMRAVLGIPSMTIKTVGGIYWQALKLFFKGVPVYPHPASKE